MMDEAQTFDNRANFSHLGTRLRSAREALNLSEKDAAGRLHLNVKFISMMENGSFDNGLPPTFMRGYLRSYGKLLNIMEDEINATLDQLGMAEPQPQPTIQQFSMPSPMQYNPERIARWITYGIILFVIAMLIIWWNSHTRESAIEAAVQTTPAAVTTVESQPQPAVETPVAPTPTQVIPNTPPGSTPAVAPEAPVPTLAAPTPPTPPSQPAVQTQKSIPATALTPAIGPKTATNQAENSNAAADDEDNTPKETSKSQVKMFTPEPGLEGGEEFQ